MDTHSCTATSCAVGCGVHCAILSEVQTVSFVVPRQPCWLSPCICKLVAAAEELRANMHRAHSVPFGGVVVVWWFCLCFSGSSPGTLLPAPRCIRANMHRAHSVPFGCVGRVCLLHPLCTLPLLCQEFTWHPAPCTKECTRANMHGAHSVPFDGCGSFTHPLCTLPLLGQ